jgi:hypothetical protein
MGNFFQGFADGLQKGQEHALRQRQQENSDKQMAMAEEDHAAKVEERDRNKKLGETISQLLSPDHAEFGAVNGGQAQGNLGQQATPQVQPASGPTANVSPSSGGVVPQAEGAPQPKPQLSPIEFQALLMRRDQAVMAATAAAKGLPPEMAMEFSKRQQEMAKSAEGQAVLSALSGDPKGIQAIAPKLGLDPASTKYLSKDGKAYFTDASGKMADITMYALAHGVWEHSIKPMLEAEHAGKAAVIDDNTLKTSNFRTGNLASDRDLDVKVKEAGIRKDNNVGSAALARARGAGGGSATAASKAVLAAVKAVAPKDDELANPSIAHIVANKYNNDPTKAPQAFMDYKAVVSQADAWIKTLTPEQKKQLSSQVGGDLRSAAVMKAIQGKSQSNVAGAVADDEEE